MHEGKECERLPQGWPPCACACVRRVGDGIVTVSVQRYKRPPFDLHPRPHNRYHGPLAAQEAMGTESPGPGCYELPSPTARAGSPATRFGTSGRDSGAKLYISHMHAAAEGFGTASPGPGCYNVADAGGVGSPSRFRAKVAPKVRGCGGCERERGRHGAVCAHRSRGFCGMRDG